MDDDKDELTARQQATTDIYTSHNTTHVQLTYDDTGHMDTSMYTTVTCNNTHGHGHRTRHLDIDTYNSRTHSTQYNTQTQTVECHHTRTLSFYNKLEA